MSDEIPGGILIVNILALRFAIFWRNCRLNAVRRTNGEVSKNFDVNVQRFATITAAATALSVGCATERGPSGGSKDLKGPTLVGVEPPYAQTDVRPAKVIFAFDKYLEAGDFSKGVFISPVPEKKPEFYTQGKRLHVKFRAPLKDSTTYVFTLGAGLRDFHEKQPLNPPLMYAFSTGPRLDTCTVFGRVNDAFSARPVAEATVMLFDADSVADGNYVRRRPVYAAQTDSGGKYALRYLKPGRYRIFGVVEKDGNFRYNAPTEKVVFAFDDELEIFERWSDAGKSMACFRSVNLVSFLPDTFAPRLISIAPLNDRNFLLNFNEPVVEVRIRPGIQSKDTVALRASEVRPPDSGFVRLFGLETDGPKSVRLPASVFERGDTLRFRLWAADTAGMWTDTTLTFTPKPTGKTRSLRCAKASPPDDAPSTLALVFDSPVSPPYNGVYWLDTANIKIAARPRPGRSPYEMFLLPPNDSLNKFRWVVDTSFVSDDGFRLDSLISEKYNPPSFDNFASVRGTSLKANVVVFLSSTRKTYGTRPNADGVFGFPYVPAGEYTLYAVHDEDGNGRWTPGSLTPRRLPEKIVYHPEKLKLRAGWKTENIRLTAE